MAVLCRESTGLARHLPFEKGSDWDCWLFHCLNCSVSCPFRPSCVNYRHYVHFVDMFPAGTKLPNRACICETTYSSAVAGSNLASLICGTLHRPDSCGLGLVNPGSTSLPTNSFHFFSLSFLLSKLHISERESEMPFGHDIHPCCFICRGGFSLCDVIEHRGEPIWAKGGAGTRRPSGVMAPLGLHVSVSSRKEKWPLPRVYRARTWRSMDSGQGCRNGRSLARVLSIKVTVDRGCHVPRAF